MKLLFYLFVVLFILGCTTENKRVPTPLWLDTLWIDESPVDTEVLNKIYNAKTIKDIFPYE